MDLGIADKTVLVTGGSRGVGRALVLALAGEGANVAFSYASNRAAADEVVDAVRTRYGTGVRAVALAADLSAAEQAEGLYDAARDALGPIDVLVNNAGIWLKGWATEISLADWQRTMAVNATAPFLLSRRLVRDLQAAGRPGKIINVTSQAAFFGSTTGHSHYAASKAALVAFTVSLAREVARDGITVNAVALGLVETDMLADALAADREYYEKRVPLGRLATPGDIAGIVTFLASFLSDYMTGATLDATGGMLMR
ncbi:3-oxoacyl-(acyl-carrier-protein) reductase FabG [uncultured Alphaproteobacteria bacterium]|uniref:3-oxoacyl-(Acyl-carrier-protein) reductase FabG n=1 Tax=uncultured Alphaproteobacteria bacterium TaxID=91750 RepID=A0A212JHN5_9PROT|nr:3-oxoacyl-(acyl-carrier-protein) reductase FabG [uncultured Alphaproteobacteria bacterium]